VVIHWIQGAYDLIIFMFFQFNGSHRSIHGARHWTQFLENEIGNAGLAWMFMLWIMSCKYYVDVLSMHMYNTVFDLNMYKMFVLETPCRT